MQMVVTLLVKNISLKSVDKLLVTQDSATGLSCSTHLITCPRPPNPHAVVVWMKISFIDSDIGTLGPGWWCYSGRFKGCGLVGGSSPLEADFESLKTCTTSCLPSLPPVGGGRRELSASVSGCHTCLPSCLPSMTEFCPSRITSQIFSSLSCLGHGILS